MGGKRRNLATLFASGVCAAEVARRPNSHATATSRRARKGAPALAVLALAALAPSVGAAQAPAAEPPAAVEPPRTPWGDPDLGGVWDFRTITPLERPEEYGDREFLTPEEAAALEQGAVDRDQERFAAPARRTEAGGSIGAYNWFWMDYGTRVVESRRTSLIIDPPNGRKPPPTPGGTGSGWVPGSFGGAPLEQVEDLSLFDRCLGTLGLPIFPSAYNNNIQLFQTPDHVVMLIEMMNDVRFIPLDGRPHGEVRQWMGDSRGRWEADTLVVETTDLYQPLVGGASRNARLVERFTRVSPGILEYRYTVDDPTVWTRPWTAVLTLRLSPDPLFEYACHEGNYGLPNMLAGARQEEAAAAADGAR